MKQVVIHWEKGLTKVALLEDGQLAEYYVERPADKQWLGNIYKGRVVNVLPGMQAAFIDIGLAKNAFLYIDDVLPAHMDKQLKTKPSTAISQLLHEGQEITVQVAKEPFGTKGARVTTHYFIPGRWIVYMPLAGYVGVSRKIELETERERLKDIGELLRKPEEGLIVRTVAEGETQEAIEKDLKFLRGLWTAICDREQAAKAPTVLYRDLDMIPRLCRDMITDDTEQVIINNEEKGREVIGFLHNISPKLAAKVRIINDSESPIFQQFGIQEQIKKCFNKKIWLKSGGHIIWDQTEALTVIDVNTGKYTGSVDLEETAFHTNMEAAEMVARQIRLRDSGGIVIVDFIDMEKDEHRRKIEEKLEEVMKHDRTKSIVVGWTRLGLLEITRKKIRDTMERLYEPCPCCNGSGKVYAKLHPLF